MPHAKIVQQPVFSRIVTVLDKDVADKLDCACAFMYPGSEFMPEVRNMMWDGARHLFSTKTFSFPTGLTNKIHGLLVENGYTVEIEPPQITVQQINAGVFNLELRDYQQEAMDKAKENPRGIFSLVTGCHAKGTKILMFDGTIKQVEDVVVGDILIGPDSAPRKVLELHRGKSDMYKITPTKGDAFVVNEDHLLYLQRTNTRSWYRTGEKTIKRANPTYQGPNPDCTISVKDYLVQTDRFKHQFKLKRVGIDCWKTSKQSIPPYILGVWLGDGGYDRPSITTMDDEVLQEWSAYGKKNKLTCTANIYGGHCPSYYLTGSYNTKNTFVEQLKKLGVYKNKHIPNKYKIASRVSRLELLAGLLDTDGSLAHNGFDFINVNKSISEDVAFIARSVGLAAKFSQCEKSCKTKNGKFTGTYYRVSISGNTDCVPTRIKRKQATSRKQVKDVLRTGFTVESMGFGEYYGFTLNKDHLYLTGDFMIHHNSGKTEIACGIMHDKKVSTLILVHRKELMYQMQERIQKRLGITVGLVGDGHEEHADITIAMLQTLMTALDLTDKEVKDKDETKIHKENLLRYQMLMIDECHCAGSNTFYSVTKALRNAVYRYGFSATPLLRDNSNLLTESALGPVLYQKRAKDLRGKYLADLDLYFVKFPHKSVPKGVQYPTLYNQEVINNLERNKLVVDLVAKCGDKRVLIAVRNIDHGKILQSMIPDSVFIHGSLKTKERQQILKDFEEGKIKKVITTVILEQGVDIPALEVLVDVRAEKSAIGFIQLLGRVMRKTPVKNRAVALDVFDTGCRWLSSHAKERMEIAIAELGDVHFVKSHK